MRVVHLVVFVLFFLPRPKFDVRLGLWMFCNAEFPSDTQEKTGRILAWVHQDNPEENKRLYTPHRTLLITQG